MHGDNSRDTYRRRNGYVSVLAQQGRPLLDPETNEQAAIHVDAERALAFDIIGQHGGTGDAFNIGYVKKTGNTKASLTIGPGRYYVDGIPVDSRRPAPWSAVPDPEADGQNGEVPPTNWTYWDQPYAFRDVKLDDDDLPGFPFLVYLRVNDRLVTAVLGAVSARTCPGPGVAGHNRARPRRLERAHARVRRGSGRRHRRVGRI
jgi:Family of unknown function (DUF6519)